MKEQPTGKDLIRIAVTTGVIHSVFWSTFIFSINTLGILEVGQLYNVIWIGSALWGLFGALMTYRRNKDYIKITYLDDLVEQFIGVSDESSKIAKAVFDYCYFPFSKCGKW